MEVFLFLFSIGSGILACSNERLGETDTPPFNPSYQKVVGEDFKLVKNWDFGSKDSIRNMSDLNNEFFYLDQFGMVASGTNYGAIPLVPDTEHALVETSTGYQPVEDPDYRVREFTDHSLKTYLVPLDGADTCLARSHNVGCGSFMAKWKL